MSHLFPFFRCLPGAYSCPYCANRCVDLSQIKCFLTACMHASLFQVLDNMTFNSLQREVSSIVGHGCRKPEMEGVESSWQVKVYRQSEGNKREVQINRRGVNPPEVPPQICLTFLFSCLPQLCLFAILPYRCVLCEPSLIRFDKHRSQENTNVAFSVFSTTWKRS